MLRTLQKQVAGGLRTQWSRMVSNSVPGSPALDEDIAEIDTRRRVEKSMNRVTLLGRVGKDPEERGSAEHRCLIFPLATNFVYRKADGERMVKTDWHRVAVFRPGLRDNVASKLFKGDRIFVEGSLSYMRYTDSDNKSINVVSINADDIIRLSQQQNTNQAVEEEEI